MRITLFDSYTVFLTVHCEADALQEILLLDNCQCVILLVNISCFLL